MDSYMGSFCFTNGLIPKALKHHEFAKVSFLKPYKGTRDQNLLMWNTPEKTAIGPRGIWLERQIFFYCFVCLFVTFRGLRTQQIDTNWDLWEMA